MPFSSKKILLFYTFILIFVCLYPRRSNNNQSDEISSGQMPKEGDNFKIVQQPAVFRLVEGKIRRYLSAVSFFNYPENKAFGTPYAQGGILICDQTVFTILSEGDYMPIEPNGVSLVWKKQKYWASFWEAFFRKDKAAHALGYFIWAILFCIFLYPFSYSLLQKVSTILVLGFFLGLSIEFLQYYLSVGRAAEGLDLLFNTLGLLAGLFVYEYRKRKQQAIVNR